MATWRGEDAVLGRFSQFRDHPHARIGGLIGKIGPKQRIVLMVGKDAPRPQIADRDDAIERGTTGGAAPLQ